MHLCIISSRPEIGARRLYDDQTETVETVPEVTFEVIPAGK
jgi:hypothetical protein